MNKNRKLVNVTSPFEDKIIVVYEKGETNDGKFKCYSKKDKYFEKKDLNTEITQE